jgi:hypothetical protein
VHHKRAFLSFRSNSGIANPIFEHLAGRRVYAKYLSHYEIASGMPTATILRLALPKPR